MVGHQNETKRHFELRNLDEDMRRASKEAARVTPKKSARLLRAQTWGLLVILITLIGLLAYLLGIF